MEHGSDPGGSSRSVTARISSPRKLRPEFEAGSRAGPVGSIREGAASMQEIRIVQVDHIARLGDVRLPVSHGSEVPADEHPGPVEGEIEHFFIECAAVRLHR